MSWETFSALGANRLQTVFKHACGSMSFQTHEGWDGFQWGAHHLAREKRHRFRGHVGLHRDELQQLSLRAHHEQSTIAPVTQHASVEQICAHGVRGRTVAGRACESQIGEMVIWFRKAVPSFR